ncbi:MAG: hypothetical protein WC574_05510 [Candidatus Omnitrophota bacterium]
MESIREVFKKLVDTRNLFRGILVFLSVLIILSGSPVKANAQISNIKKLSQQEIDQIGESIFKNECASKEENLISWNAGEDFMSLGIGHFIWYPARGKRIFVGSFVKFLEYAKLSGEKIPRWLDKQPVPACPWISRDSFLSVKSDSRLTDLKDFLTKTKSLQAAFIIKRLDEALPLILKHLPEGRRERIAFQLDRLASTFLGVYVLADYTNFKGLGITPSEYYRGKGWGLLQVLEEMRSAKEAPDAIREFVRSANIVLENRVKNSPVGRNEQKWLPGWQKRINSYIK